MLIEALGMALACSILVKYACDSFEAASGHLGREVFRMPPGVRGATLEAIGSSLPELLTTSFLLFAYADLGGFAAGIATCAGSAVFNAVVIPALCVLAVTVKSRAMPEPLPFILLDRSTVLRDGLFFLAAELVLIYFLAGPALTGLMGVGLVAIYLVYFSYLLRQLRQGGDDGAEDLDEETDTPPLRPRSLRTWGVRLLTLDWNGLLFGGRPYSARSAWIVLGLSVATLSIACHGLATAVMRSAEALGVPAYFTAVILGAAATSVPDTFISVGNALRGEYDDAVANAVGSNIFDICVALGLPLAVYGFVYGEVPLGVGAGEADIQTLRVALLVVTACVLGLFLFGGRDGNATRVGRGKAAVLLMLYLLWNLTIFVQAADAGGHSGFGLALLGGG